MNTTRREQWETVRRLMQARPDWCAAVLQSMGHDEDEPRHNASPTARFCDALALYGASHDDAPPPQWRAAFTRAGLHGSTGSEPAALIPWEHIQQEQRHKID